MEEREEDKEEGQGVKQWISANKRDIIIVVILIIASIYGVVSYTKSTIPKPIKVE